MSTSDMMDVIQVTDWIHITLIVYEQGAVTVIWRPQAKIDMWLCGCVHKHVEKYFMREYHPTLEKCISARLMEDFTIHRMAASFALTMIYQLY